MTDRELVDAFLKGKRIDTSNDYDLYRKVDFPSNRPDWDFISVFSLLAAAVLGLFRSGRNHGRTTEAQP